MKTITKNLLLVFLTILALFIQVNINAEPTPASNGNCATLSPITAPTVITNHATNITQTGATLNGHVNANGDSTSVSFQYGITTSYGSTISAGFVTGSSMTPVSAPITGLSPGTTYHFRAKGSNLYGTVYGNDSVFTTSAPTSAPTVITGQATNVSQTTATLHGQVNANGSTTTASFQYGLTTSYGSTISAGTVNGTSMTPVSAPITGLSPATTYHCRAVGTNTFGTTYGLDSIFYTLSASPTVITNHATSITQTSATLNGHVNANGYTTTVTFQYGTTTSYGYTIGAGTVNGTSLTPVSAPITGLSPNTVYHFRATGTNSYGTTYGSDSVFTTLPSNSAPTVITKQATNITQTTATLNGQVNANGSSTTVSFQYGLTTSYGSTVSAGTVNGSTLTSVSAPITGLSPYTPYHFRAVGTNTYGTTYGVDSIFYTLSAYPTVITNHATSITQTSATLNGHVNANGYTTTVTFDYGITVSYGSTINAGTVNGTSMTPVSAPLTGLSPNTTYHFRANGTNSYGTTNGNDSVFTTLPSNSAPTVITNNATNITQTTATLNGEVNANGSSTTVTFQYGLTTSYGSTVSAGTVNGSSMTPVSAPVTGLSANTTYHCRAVGSNTYGTTYGNDSVFTTLSSNSPPTVITNNATNITQTSATLNGHVNANGYTTTASFQYGLTTSYGSTVSAGTVNGTSMTPINAGISGLSPGTLYHFRAVGSNSYGTTYGYDTSFTTSVSATPPTVSTRPASSITTQSATLNGLVNANGSLTTVSFQYGLTTAYGNSGSAGTVSGYSQDSVFLNISGLSPSTLYHFRIVGTNAGGTSYGADLTFTTDSSAGCHAVMSYTQTAPLTVQFHNNSAPGYTFDLWDFGDGNISSDTDPLWVYAAPGSYQIKLLVYYGAIPCIDSVIQTVQVTDSTISCQAAFTANIDSINHNTVHFVDHSTGNILNWFWNFGDDSTSVLQNPVHTFPGPGTYNVCLSINGPNCLNSTCQEVQVGTNSNCISYFTHTTSGLDVTFTGHLFSGAPATYNWVFGDGQTGQGQINNHHYSVAGVYYVTLNTIDSTDCQYNSGQSVSVGDSAQYHEIYGQVFASGVPVTSGLVTLFSVDTVAPYFPLIYVVNLDSTGVYYFGNVPNGDFYLYATPLADSNYLPTYYGDILDWQEATIIHIGVPDNPYNINLIPAQNLPLGNGSIHGQIYISGLKTTLLDKVTLLLMNSSMQAGRSLRANVDGSFTFSTLGNGTYYLRAEMAGVKSDIIIVNLSASNPTVSVVMTFAGTRITGVDEISSKISTIKIYPNPVNDELHASFHLRSSSRISATLVNSTGLTVTVITRLLNDNDTEITIPVGSLIPGLYMLRITTDTGTSITTKIIKQ
jgi:PKD repeat protein